MFPRSRKQTIENTPKTQNKQTGPR